MQRFKKAVISAMNKGGLYTCNLQASNLVMLSKWWWGFFNKKDALWCKIIRSTLGEYGGL